MQSEMKPEVKEQWLEALRSGDYEQGRHYLAHTDGGHCCLGVLAKACGDSEAWVGAFYRGNRQVLNMDPDTGLDEFGLSDITRSKLMDMNDGVTGPEGFRQAPKSFDEIADWIEANIPTAPPANDNV